MKTYKYLLIDKQDRLNKDNPVKASVMKELVKELQIEKMIEVIQYVAEKSDHKRLAFKARGIIESLESRDSIERVVSQKKAIFKKESSVKMSKEEIIEGLKIK